MSYPDVQLFIDGKWLDAADGKTISVLNPATGAEIGRVAHAAVADLERTVIAAKRGFETWRELPAIERNIVMRNAAKILRERMPDIAPLLTLEQGKPLSEAKGEILAAADMIDWFADEGLRIYGRVVPSRFNNSTRQVVVRDPVGPVAAFTPWNFPINQIVRKLGAALACGCSMIVKAPEETPASPAALVSAFADAGLPQGVLGLVFGNPSEISNYLIPHPIIRKVTFTGSTPIGKQLAALAGQHLKRVTMELGGHAPVIICEDADVGLAVKSIGAAKFRNAGQVCISPTRFLVHESIKNEFVTAIAEYGAGLRVGDGLEPNTKMGPLANERRVTAMEDFTHDAISKGATLELGGQRLDREGYFWQPTVLSEVPLDAKVFNDEPFGPIAAIRGFSAIDEAIAESNRLPFGLSGYAFTRSLKNADILGRKMEVGMLWINMQAMPSAELPFGGIKESGIGTEGGSEAMEAYLNVRSIATANV
ncbi:NAD-dependent succinate-semialdehyde dehydrogenase [Cupriavidus sp. 2SB]|uniref:NAD-dependent succinate-semialdehyde dehydrogenase n=1 Tax=Cupriavidus sp. 2SB TaxID=2502199 RepID=UPI0010F6471D|nr:NAD-dependent succinate-semialdehyde dehydrogenase [Cupriavidus sp. 2SB]